MTKDEDDMTDKLWTLEYTVPTTRRVVVLAETAEEAQERVFDDSLGHIVARSAEVTECEDPVVEVAEVTRPAVVDVGRVHPGNVLLVDEGYECMRPYSLHVVRKDHNGELYIPCDVGEHYLDGQLNDDGTQYFGFWMLRDLQEAE